MAVGTQCCAIRLHFVGAGHEEHRMQGHDLKGAVVLLVSCMPPLVFRGKVGRILCIRLLVLRHHAASMP